MCRFWKKWFKIWSFLEVLIQKFFLFQTFFSQNKAFEESMGKPNLTFSRWKLTQKTDFSTTIFWTNLDHLEKIFNSKQNVFPQRFLSQNQFFRKSLKILSFWSFYDKKQPQKKKFWKACFPTNFFFREKIIRKPDAFWSFRFNNWRVVKNKIQNLTRS